MSPKAFGMADLTSCIVTVLILAFLFIYPSAHIHAFRDELTAKCDILTDAAQNEDWEDAVSLSLEIQRRFNEEVKLLRFVFDHEDIDSAEDAINSTVLMASRHDATETVIEAANIKSVITYLAGIETFSLDNLF